MYFLFYAWAFDDVVKFKNAELQGLIFLVREVLSFRLKNKLARM